MKSRLASEARWEAANDVRSKLSSSEVRFKLSNEDSEIGEELHMFDVGKARVFAVHVVGLPCEQSKEDVLTPKSQQTHALLKGAESSIHQIMG
jgi:hypothetical protein